MPCSIPCQASSAWKLTPWSPNNLPSQTCCEGPRGTDPEEGRGPKSGSDSRAKRARRASRAGGMCALMYLADIYGLDVPSGRSHFDVILHASPGRHMRGSGNTPLEDFGRPDGITSTSGRHVQSPCMAMQVMQPLGQLSSHSSSEHLIKRILQTRDVWPISLRVGHRPSWIQGPVGMSAVPLMTRKHQYTPWPMSRGQSLPPKYSSPSNCPSNLTQSHPVILPIQSYPISHCHLAHPVCRVPPEASALDTDEIPFRFWIDFQVLSSPVKG